MAATGRSFLASFARFGRGYNAAATGKQLSNLTLSYAGTSSTSTIANWRPFWAGSYMLTRKYSTHSPRTRKRDLYSILNVTPHATQAEIKDAYYKLSMKYHPDRNQGSLDKAHTLFTELTEAYSILGQYESRRKYDKGLHGGYAPPTTTQKERPVQWASKISPDKTPAYDFDAFYRAHYGEALRRDQMDRKRAKQKKKEKEVAITSPQLQWAGIIATIMAATIPYYYMQFKQYRLNQTIDHQLKYGNTVP